MFNVFWFKILGTSEGINISSFADNQAFDWTTFVWKSVNVMLELRLFPAKASPLILKSMSHLQRSGSRWNF